MRKKTAASPAAVSSCRKSLFATTRHLSELQKALKDGDHHRAGHPSRVSRTHPSAPLTKGSRSFGWPRNRRISCGGFVVSKKSFRHDETSFRASKSSERWGSSSCRTPFPGFPHTPFRPVDERFPLFGWPRNRRISCGGFFHIWRGGAHTLSVKGRDALCGEKSYCCAVARCC